MTNVKYLTAIQKTLLRMIKTFQIKKFAAFGVAEKWNDKHKKNLVWRKIIELTELIYNGRIQGMEKRGRNYKQD